MKIKNLFGALLALAIGTCQAQTFPVNNITISGTMTGPQQPANTILANTANLTGAASPTTLPSCASGAINYTPGTGFGCLTLTTNSLTYTQGAIGSASRTVTNKFQDTASILDFAGCDPTGSADSTTCIQNAINAAAKGLSVIVPPGVYSISSTLTIGNGSVSAASTTYGQQITGLGVGSANNEGPVVYPVVLKWTGASGGTMMQVNGPIWGIRLSGLSFNANALANTCINWQHPIGSEFSDLLCANYKGAAFVHTAYSEPVGVVVGSSDNVFQNVMAKGPSTGGSGILIGVSAIGGTKNLDVARNVYINDHFDFDGTTSTTYGIQLAFVDNVTFIETTTARVGGSGGVGLFINPPSGTTGFPGAVSFFNSPLQGNTAFPSAGAWHPPTGIGFWPYPTGDGEAVPSASVPGTVYGITDSGIFFGASGGTPVYNAAGTVQYNNHTVYGTVQMSGGSATVTLSGPAVFSSIATYSCVATDESAVSAVKALINSGSSITFGASGASDFVNYICTGH